jgi:hypothetical protein
MDESTPSGPVETDSSAPSPAVDMNTTGPAPAADTPANDPNPQTPPVPTGPAPETPDPDLPDHGINPDKGIDPDAGDEPTTGESPEESVDLKKMSRAERAEYFRDLQGQTRKTVETAISAAYQPQDVQELQQSYMEQGYDEGTSLMLARQEVAEQKTTLAEATAQIAELNANMRVEAYDVMHSIDWLNPANKDKGFDEKLFNKSGEVFEKLSTTTDPRTGQIIDTKMSVKEFYSFLNDIRQSGIESARVEGQKAAEQQLAAVAPPSSNTNRRETPFENLSAAEMREQLLSKGVNVT